MILPKAQPFPTSRVKIGAILFEAFSYVDDGKVVIGFNEWVVRTIRARRNSITTWGVMHTHVKCGGAGPKKVNLTEKNRTTWGKRSTKAGDFGWLKKIPAQYKKQFSVGDDLPFGLYTTKRAALRYVLAYYIDDERELGAAIAAETDEGAVSELKQELADSVLLVPAIRRRLKALSAA